MEGSDPNSQQVRPARILVLEDHHDTAHMMHRILSHDGYRVMLAATLAQAREACLEHTFDLLISDIELPDGEVYDLVRAGEVCHGMRAIVISGHGMAAHIERSRQAGIAAHLIKPFSITQLRDAIRRVMG